MSTWIVSATAATAGALLGVGIAYWLTRIKELEKRRIPKDWPLKVRPLANSRERQVWLWLNRVMADQRILLKLPVTRFTTPIEHKEAAYWYQLLNGLYCTFTVCTSDGMVLGCIDVPGRQGLLQGNQTLKHRLLGQCNIPYWVVDPENLPHTKQIRAAFLGEQASTSPSASSLDSRFKDVRENLQAAVTKRRLGKHEHLAALEAQLARERGFSDSRIPAGWEQNSFITPLDSRSAPLSS